MSGSRADSLCNPKQAAAMDRTTRGTPEVICVGVTID